MNTRACSNQDLHQGGLKDESASIIGQVSSEGHERKNRIIDRAADGARLEIAGEKTR